MTQPAKSQEPSMEEILASIRRIIADDDANKTAQRTAEPPKAAAPPPPQPAARPAPPPPPRAPAPVTQVVPPPEPSFAEAGADAQPEPEPEPTAEADDEASDILDLTEQMASAPDAAPQFRTIDGSFDVSYEDAVERSASELPTPEPHLGFGGEERSQLMSRSTSAAVDSAFNTLAQTVLVQNARTLEDLVREMLRPMLKAWLDDNLPGMVERLVRAEIERVSRGRMG